MSPTTFGTRLRAIREAQGLSARAAAAAAGFSEALWRQYEKGERQVTKDVTVPVTPTLKNVRAAASAVSWDLADALAAAGFEKEAVAEREAPARPALSVVPTTLDEMPPVEEDNEVLAAIRRDPDLDETSRAHFMNQYVLLSKLSRLSRQGDDRGLLPYVAHGERTEPVDVEEERRLEEIAKQAARDNPDSPYRDK